MARRPAPAHVAEALGKQPQDPIISVSRVLLSQGTPEILERQYFPLEVGMHVLAMDPDDDDIHRELLREGVDLNSCIRASEVIRADSTTSQLLEVQEGTALIASRIHVADSAGTPVEYAEYICPADRRKFQLTVVKGERIPLHSNIQFEPSSHWSFDDAF
ncbi:MAG: UTRA domain-containing protein [Corynebacterium casei]|nr:UTRA domain-containing protein [Corynebacterium casei]